MGYNIDIGNAVPFADEDRFGWRVESARSESAPTFPNDEMTGNSNSRSPSYTAWHGFCEAAGIEPLFYEKWEGLLCSHPGIVLLTKAHHETVKGALDAFKAKHPTTEPGFTGYGGPNDTPFTGDDHSPILARLIWLEWWMAWALENCEHPAIENT